MRWCRKVAFAALILLAAGCWRSSDGPQAPPASGGQTPESEASRLQSLGYLESTGRVEQVRRIAVPSPAQAAGSGPVAAPVSPGTGVGALDAIWAQQKLIREGRIEVEVESVDATVERIGEVAGARRALVAGSEVRRGADGRKSGTVTLKIPAEGFEAILADLRELGKVRSETTTTQDVTKAYTDLEARLDVKRRTQTRLEAILARRAGSLAELLQVERELERVVTEIERMSGEKRYYDQRIAVSTIAILLFEPGAAPRSSAFDPLREAMRDALRVLAESLAALIFVAMSALPWVLVAWLVWALVRRARRRRAMPAGD